MGASSRIRSYQYLTYLEGQGIDVTVAPLLSDDYLRNLYAGRRTSMREVFRAYLLRLQLMLRSRRFDLLWVEKELLPWLPSWGEEVLQRMGVPYVVDYDDAVFHRYNQHPKGLVRALLSGKIDAVMRRAALVIVGNDYLGDHARRAGARRVEFLPSVVDLDRYGVGRRSGHEVFTVGWIGSPATVRYLDLLRPGLAALCEAGNVRLVLVGSGDVDLGGLPVEVRAWSEETEVEDVRSFDVGVMPLRDGPWERGKCGYKLIQYMACGLPAVASPVGANKRIVDNGVNGFLATGPEDWQRALTTLRDDAGLREQMGDAGRTKIEAGFTVQATGPRLAALLRGALE